MSFNEKLSYTEFVVESPTTDFNIGFSFTEGIDKLGLLIDDVDATEAGYTYRLKNSMTLEVTPPIASGIVRIYRETNLDSTRHVFKAAAKFVAANMDTNFTQLLHSQQEIRDQTAAFYDRVDIQIEDFTSLVSDVQAEFQDVRDTANAAEATAEAANATSATALQVASGIESTAQQALDNSVEALNTANAIDAKAELALTNAASAVSTANAAETTANGIASTASNAVVIAESAQLTADTAEGIANDALLIAQDALDQTELQPATETVLGGIKVGVGLAVQSDGTLSTAGTMPLGVPLWHNGLRVTIPIGHLPYDGLTYRRADYPAFWTKIQSTFSVISDTEWLTNPLKRGCYSSGDGSTTFRMPDLNGTQSGSIKAPVLRGDGGGTVAGETKTVGQVDTDAIRDHNHILMTGRNDSANAHNSGSMKGHVGAGYTPTYDVGSEWVRSVADSPVANENRPNSVYGIWICRVGDTLTEVADPTKYAVLTGGNTFDGNQEVNGDITVIGSQAVHGDVTVAGAFTADIKPLLNALGDAPVFGFRASAFFNGVNGISGATLRNMSSVERLSYGKYKCNFLVPMLDANYGVKGTACMKVNDANGSGIMIIEQTVDYFTFYVKVGGWSDVFDVDYIYVEVS